MNESSPLGCATSPSLRRVVGVAVAVLAWIAVDEGISLVRGFGAGFDTPDTPSAFRVLTTYLLPVFGGVTLAVLIRFARQGGPLRWTPGVIAGFLFIVGGALLDVTVTLTKSPDLVLEANPYVRALLDSQHPLWFVYLHLGLTQLPFVLVFCMFWAAFLRHRPMLLREIDAVHPRSPLEFLKAATGGGRLSYRQWLMPLHRAEFPLFYCTLWAIVLSVVFGITLFRYYAALEWLDVFAPQFAARVLVLMVGLCGALVIYFVALERHYRAFRTAAEN